MPSVLPGPKPVTAAPIPKSGPTAAEVAKQNAPPTLQPTLASLAGTSLLPSGAPNSEHKKPAPKEDDDLFDFEDEDWTDG
ncbi:hypothetical protein G6F67_009735 [Rhizopus microsporus]|nr:hypothetical protein G6F67_009735 [Rhizopus microsporus]